MKYTNRKQTLAGYLSLVVIGSVAPAAAGSTVTAGNPYVAGGVFSELVGVGYSVPPSYGEIIDRRMAQTFTAGTGGVVDQVSFRAANLFGHPTDLRVAIAEVDSGQIGATLGSLLVDFNAIPGSPPPPSVDLNIVADFLTEGITLEQGRQYALVFSTDVSEANYSLYGSRPASGSEYLGGLVYRSVAGAPYDPAAGQSDDLFFQVTVVPIPEPATAGLVLLGGLFMVSRRRRG